MICAIFLMISFLELKVLSNKNANFVTELREFRVPARIGAYLWEKQITQNIACIISLKTQGFVDYDYVLQYVRDFVLEKHRDYIEELVEDLAEDLFANIENTLCIRVEVVKFLVTGEEASARYEIRS